MTTKSLPDMLGTLLINQGIGSAVKTAPWFVTVGRQMQDPDKQITLLDAGGTPGLPSLLLDYPSVQVRVRGGRDDYAGTYAKINDIRAYLNGINPLDLEDGSHLSGLIIGVDILPIGYDTNSRPEFVVTFNSFLERAVGNSTFEHRDSL